VRFLGAVSSTNCCTITKFENCCITLHTHVSHSSYKWNMVIPVYVHHTTVCCVFKLEVWSCWNCFNLLLDHIAIWKSPVPSRLSGTETETKNVLKSRDHVRYTGCPRRNVPNFRRVFLMLKYTDITQNTYVQSQTVTEIMAREVWNFDSCYILIDYQIHIKTGRNMWFL